MPPGFLFVSTEPVPGWSTKVTMRKLDKPVEQFGEQITEEVGRITFTGDGQTGVIRPGQFQDFGLSVGVPDKKPGSALTFKALQTYSNGEIVRWIGPPDSEQPAPQVKLAAAEGEEGGGRGGRPGAAGARCRRGGRRQQHAGDHRARGRPGRACGRPGGALHGTPSQCRPAPRSASGRHAARAAWRPQLFTTAVSLRTA